MKLESLHINVPAEKYLVGILPRLKEKRVRAYTTIALSLVTFTFLGIFAINPTLSTITDLQKQIQDDQFVSQQLQTKITNLSQLAQSYKLMQNNFQYVYTAVPQTPDPTTLIGQIQTLANADNVSILHIETLPVEVTSSANSFSSYSFALDASGSYTNISSFLKALSGLSRLVTIDAISLTSNAKTTDLTLSLRGSVYFKAN